MFNINPNRVNDVIGLLLADEQSDFLTLTRRLRLDPTVDFRGADLRGVVLAGLNLAGFNFDEADLSEADLSHADLRYASLVGATLNNTSVEGTLWPIPNAPSPTSHQERNKSSHFSRPESPLYQTMAKLVSGTAQSSSSRLSELEPVGIVEIGVSRVRFSVLEGIGANAALDESSEEVERDNLASFDAALKGIRSRLRILGVKKVFAWATSDLDLHNLGSDLKAAWEESLGTEIRTATHDDDLERILGPVRECLPQWSGIAFFISQFETAFGMLSASSVTSGVRSLRGSLSGAAALQTLKSALSNLRTTSQSVHSPDVLALGGDLPLALATMLQKNTRYPINCANGFTMRTGELVVLLNRLADPVSSNEAVEESIYRRVLTDAPLILEVIRTLEPKEIVFWDAQWCHAALSALRSNSESDDPVLEASKDFARLRSRSAMFSTEELSAFGDAFFGKWKTGEDGDQRRARHLAAIFVGSSWREQNSERGEVAVRACLSARFLATLPHRMRATTAFIVANSFPYAVDTADQLLPFLTITERLHGRVSGSLIRFASSVAGSMPGILDEFQFSIDGNTLVLTVPLVHSDLVEMPSVLADFKALAEAAHLVPNIVVLGRVTP